MNLSRFALISAVSVFAFAPVMGAEAAIISSNFQVTLDSGDLSPNTYNGSFSYDDDETPQNDTFTGFDTRSLTAFNFNFNSVDYTDTFFGVVNFDSDTGDLFGISYDFNDEAGTQFSFAPDFFDPITVFTYDLSGDQGSGLFSFASTPATTPEPSLLLGIGMMGAGLLFGKKNKK